jgi:hypothetical protein
MPRVSVGAGGSDPLVIAEALADLLQMKVFAIVDPVVFRPRVQLNPPDEIRGRVRRDAELPMRFNGVGVD